MNIFISISYNHKLKHKTIAQNTKNLRPPCFHQSIKEAENEAHKRSVVLRTSPTSLIADARKHVASIGAGELEILSILSRKMLDATFINHPSTSWSVPDKRSSNGTKLGGTLFTSKRVISFFFLEYFYPSLSLLLFLFFFKSSVLLDQRRGPEFPYQSNATR